jgi:hypothetical protein
MHYKEFCEQAEIVYTLQVWVNDEHAIKVEGLSFDSVAEQQHKIDAAISETLTDQYASKAEYDAEGAEEYTR